MKIKPVTIEDALKWSRDTKLMFASKYTGIYGIVRIYAKLDGFWELENNHNTVLKDKDPAVIIKAYNQY